jgi:glycosyltransferase involved in cell wall biosynthesis
VESPPLFDGLAALCLSWLKRAPFLFTVSDLWPESAIQMGVLRNAFLIRLSKELEKTIYRHARLVLAVTQGIHKAIISEGNDSSRIVLFRAAVDCQFFRPGIDGTAMRQALGISPNELLVLYAGTLGMAHNLSVVLEVAHRCQQQGSNNIRFVLAGDGAEKHMLRRKAIALDLKNLSFIDPVPKKNMPALLNAADCVLVSLRDLPIFRGALPTKLLEAMSCSKPVIAAVGGEAEEIVRRSASGFCVGPGDAAAIYHAILKIARDPENAARMGLNGRECVLQEFSRDRRARELNDHLLGLGNGPH